MTNAARLQTKQYQAFQADVLEGLSRPQKQLSSRWLYDDRGCELFEDITRLPEYYPTRTEAGILRENSQELSEFCGRNANILEYGAGAGIKTELLLTCLQEPRSYTPIDIAAEFLDITASRLRKQFPQLRVTPVTADFTSDFSLPCAALTEGRRVAFFPGSTIGNLNTRDAGLFLQRLRRHVGSSGGSIIGVDLRKDLNLLLPAYDDAAGITAQFNLNILKRINREMEGQFVLDMFEHEARWNERECEVEMHLVSRIDQVVSVAGHGFAFRLGETIHTESSRKYEIEAFTTLAAHHGWRVHRLWTDPSRMFAVFGLS